VTNYTVKTLYSSWDLGAVFIQKQLGAVRSKIYRINKHRFRCILTKGNVRIHRVRYIKCFQKKNHCATCITLYTINAEQPANAITAFSGSQEKRYRKTRRLICQSPRSEVISITVTNWSLLLYAVVLYWYTGGSRILKGEWRRAVGLGLNPQKLIACLIAKKLSPLLH